jgi:hypothetical protein
MLTERGLSCCAERAMTDQEETCRRKENATKPSDGFGRDGDDIGSLEPAASGRRSLDRDYRAQRKPMPPDAVDGPRLARIAWGPAL